MPEFQYISQVMLTGGYYNWTGTVPCEGGTVPSDNLLNSLIGSTFGGDATTTVGIPDLRNAIMTGASAFTPLGSRTALASGSDVPTIGLTSMMAIEGRTPDWENETYYIGDILALASSSQAWEDTDWLVPCDGGLLAIREYQALYNILGIRYGGNGVQTFGVPDLRDAAAQFTLVGGGTGAAYGSGPTSAVAMTFGIVVRGPFPTRDSED